MLIVVLSKYYHALPRNTDEHRILEIARMRPTRSKMRPSVCKVYRDLKGHDK